MERVMSAIDWAVTRVLMVAAGVEAVVVISAVIARYVFNSSFPWSEEVARAMLTWLIFLGMSAAFRRDEMVSLVFFREKLSDRGVLVVRLLTIGASIVFLAVAGWYTVKLMGLTARQTLPVTGLHIAWVYAAIPVGSAISILHLINRAHGLLTKRVPLRQDYSATEEAA
ncbi:TRAP transporter small permease [Paracoccus sp. SCSIO 75233]|uniref:TRAP transporter small permease n=1 Tax=Paracoccus sp. SCSIO 75233 TaxID=3017782 RepID=UPI0022EFE092|nr:TRAP transporter small permease [Paracoccus sp. SCSIO 75233]WBU52030.1 TRAP transporter small permease [Paracoccus sp. SCSIO 75233]